MMSDASDMLAAALEQMDGIIAGKVFQQHQALAEYFLMADSIQAVKLCYFPFFFSCLFLQLCQSKKKCLYVTLPG